MTDSYYDYDEPADCSSCLGTGTEPHGEPCFVCGGDRRVSPPKEDA